MAASQYFVIVEGSASGIYNSLNEAEAKLQFNNTCNGASITSIQKYGTLLDAFNCLQAHRSSQSQPDKIDHLENEKSSSQQNSQETTSISFKSDIKLSPGGSLRKHEESTCSKSPKLVTSKHEDNGTVQGLSLVDGSKPIKTSASKLASPSNRCSPTLRTVREKSVKKEKIKTRNVCIQAERSNIECHKCKGEKKKKIALVDNGTQTKSSLQQRCVQVQTLACKDANECICCMASKVSKISLEQINWDFAMSSRVPALETLMKSCVCLRPATTCATDWYLRHDWFSLKATIPSSRMKRSSKKGSEAVKSPFRPGMKRKQSALVLKKAIKTAVQSPRGATGSTKGYKIPKKKKTESPSGDDSKDDFSDAMDMDWMQCTQARLDDVTYNSRDIPHDSVNLDYEEIFNDYLSKSVTHVIVEDAYIQINHQIQNLVRFSNMLIKRTSLKKLDLKTCKSARGANEQLQMLQEFKACLKTSRNVDFSFQFDNRLHDRIIKFSNGWSVCLGRGLDYFQKSASMLDRNDMSLRKTRAFRVITYKSNPF